MNGKKLAHYEVIEQIGAGGMGEVYLARDTKLARDVALKILPETFAQDPDRLSRFDREAKLLASLNHPNIGAIYGLERANSQRFLVLELVEGEDLSKRISHGPVAIDDVLAISFQITEALETAHEQGVIHRDLKPANIKISPDGRVKVLDFGLAKALETSSNSPDADISNSPTILGSSPTMQGVILGTAAYMSPEQARGKQVDKRSDIFAFGCVLYEMLTGTLAFQGETISDTLASILAREPDLDKVPSNTPTAIQNLLHRCLNKDPMSRLRDIGEARIIIKGVIDGTIKEPAAVTATADTAAAAQKKSSALPWVLVIVFAALAAVVGFLFLQNMNQEKLVYRLHVPPPEGTTFELPTIHPGPPELSPDGRMVAFTARRADGVVMLCVRSLDVGEAQILSGTEGAGYPFWSPDSRSLGFFAEGNLRRIGAAGGPPLTLASAPVGKGGSWNKDDVILFAPSFNDPIHRVAAAGGESTPVTRVDPSKNENSHRFPQFLPDGHHFIFFARATGSGQQGNTVYVGSLDDTTRTPLLRPQSHTVYASGHLLFLRETALMAQQFDVTALELLGDAFPLVEQVKFIPGASRGVFSASNNGVLIYDPGKGATGNEFLWLDRTGQEIGRLGEATTYDNPLLSPDAKVLAVSILDVRANTRDIWTIDVDRDIQTRFTFDSANDIEPVWSPDGSRIVFASARDGQLDLYTKSFTGAGTAELLLSTEEAKFPENWSRDGRFLVFVSVGQTTRSDLWVLPMTGDSEPQVLVKTDFGDFDPAFSPDGRWLAYTSDEPGQPEVFVTPFPGPGRKWQISSGGGFNPKWRDDGKEIVYHGMDNSIKSVTVSTEGTTFAIGASQTLFDSPATTEFEMTGDAQKFLVMAGESSQTSEPYTLVINWTEELEKR